METNKNSELLKGMTDAPDMAFTLYKALRDENGRIVDFVHELTDPKSREAAGENFAGRLLSEVSGHGMPRPETLREAVETQRSSSYVAKPGTGGAEEWRRFYISPLEGGKVAVIWQDITAQEQARSRAGEALRRWEEKYQALFRSIDEGFCIVEILTDSSGKATDYLFVEVNPAFERQTGFKNVIGQTGSALSPGAALPWLPAYSKAAATGETIQFEDYQNGPQKWYNAYAFRMDTLNGKLIGSVFSDITMQKQQEQQQEYLQKLNEALRSLPDPFAIEEAVTRTAMEHFSADRCYYAEIDGENATIRRDAFRKHLPPVAGVYPIDDFPLFKTVINEKKPLVVYDVHTSEMLDEPFRALCLRLQVISFIDIPVIKEDRVVGVLCITHSTPRRWTDIEVELAGITAERTWFVAERAKTEAALRKSEERLHVALESATDHAIITLDEQGIITSWSKGAELIFGYAEKEVLGKTGEIIFTPEDREKNIPAKEMTEAAANGSARDERWHLRRDGSRFYMSGVMAPIKMNGMIVGFVKVGRDMTEAKLLEQRKDEFISIASHELKTPVTSIKIYVDVLNEQLAKQAGNEHAGLLAKLTAQVDRLTNLINDLLDTARITDDQLHLTVEPVDMSKLLQERIDEIRATTTHDFDWTIEPTAPIMADKERIGQVITNLLTNAIRYSPAGTKIVATSRDAGHGVQVSITDKGRGIPEKDHERIFERFYRVKAENMDTYPGMGLGLYISAQIIKRHGGTISVQSVPGNGALFEFTLPYNIPFVKASREE